MRAAMGFVLLALTAPLSAQTTRCTTIGNQTTCRDTPAGSVDYGALQQPDIVGSFMEGRRLADERRARQQQHEQQQQIYQQQQQIYETQRAQIAKDNAASVVRQSVGAKIRVGDCDGAMGDALQAGEIELAQSAKALCIRH